MGCYWNRSPMLSWNFLRTMGSSVCLVTWLCSILADYPCKVELCISLWRLCMPCKVELCMYQCTYVLLCSLLLFYRHSFSRLTSQMHLCALGLGHRGKPAYISSKSCRGSNSKCKPVFSLSCDGTKYATSCHERFRATL